LTGQILPAAFPPTINQFFPSAPLYLVGKNDFHGALAGWKTNT
jgi:hypothetical protein